MNTAIDTIKQPRIKLLGIINDLSVDRLNKVPEGFNNNIIWNLAHMVAAQQGICYKRSGLDTKVTNEFFMAYKPDTKPEKFIDEAGVAEIKALLFTTLDQLQADYDDKIFVNYPPVVTRYGIELNSIDSAISFLPFHEGLHIGCIMALKKLV